MSASKPPSPKLGKSTALNMVQTVVSRLANIVPSLTTVLSPVTVYQPGANGGVGNELIVAGNAFLFNTTYGTWTAPDLNGDGSDYTVQVECFGAGGGGGGGSASAGGGGGGGGEYACEPQYPIKPGEIYSYVAGLPGTGGCNNSTQINPGASGSSGGITIFDLAGFGLAGGVVANGGQGGDQTSIGIGGSGGSGSTNTIHFNGGQGGTNNSANGSDNPISLSETSGMFVGNTLSSSIIPAWYVLSDGHIGSSQIDDNTEQLHTGKVTMYSGGLIVDGTTAPTQVPAYAIPDFPPIFPNTQVAGAAMQWKIGSLTSASAKLVAPSGASISGSKITVSCWIQCDPSGTWGNTATNSRAVVAANTANYTGNLMKGYSIFLQQTGSPAAPAWQLVASVGDGTHSRAFVSYNIGQTPGSWFYVVMTYNSGTLTLYINGASVGTATTTGYTSIPAAAFSSTVGLHPDPSNIVNWFFGYMSNVWFANDCATSTLVSQAFGTTAPTGGAGGGASGGPSATGGAGASASGATGGNGGTAVTPPTSLQSTTTASMGGFAGANAGHGDNPSVPGGGPYGGGGGGSGDMPANPSLVVLTVPFTSAATYYGTDAASNPGSQYNVGQQAHPASGLNTVLYAGGLPQDIASGSKNTMLLLPKGLEAQLAGYTINNVFLTVTNAFPSNTTESILEVGFSNDTVLPQSYTGASLTAYVAAVPIAIGAGTVTYEMTEASSASTNIITVLQNGTATALIMGPGATPTYDAFNAQTGPQFYASVYGPGAYDTFGNAQFPYLTIVMQKTATVQTGSVGAGGGIVLTAINNENTPIAFVEPFAGSDAGSNAYGVGFTGLLNSFEPGVSPTVVETWHPMTLVNSWTGTLKYQYIGAGGGMVWIQGTVSSPSSVTSTTVYTLSSAYRPQTTNDYAVGWHVTPTSGAFVRVDTSGNISIQNALGSTAYVVNIFVPLSY